MSQSNQESTLKSLRQEHAQLISILKRKGVPIPPLSLTSTNKQNSIAWLEKAIRGLKAQVNKKTATGKIHKSSVSTKKGKWTLTMAKQFVKSYKQNYDAQSIKNIEHMKTLKKGSAKTKKAIKKYDEKTKVYNDLKKEFNL